MVTTPDNVAHLWSRAAFGIDAAGADERAGRPWAELVDELVEPAAAPMARPAALDDPALAGSGEFMRALFVAGEWIEHMVTTPTPGAEKLTWFWHGHFTTSLAKVMWGEGTFLQLNMLRSRGQGPFRTLLGDVAVDSAMCLYLDNVMNLAGKVNENFARELLELFTVGVDHYTQADVLGAARSLTGHNVDWSGSFLPRFYPELHDTGPKTVLGSTGNLDAPGLCDVICNSTNRVLVARHVSRRLWSAWAHPAPSEALVAELAQSALDGGFTGRAFARAVLMHPEFQGAAARQGLVRTPLELAVSLTKLAGKPAASLGVPTALANAGHFPLLPPNVSGWPGARELTSPQSWWQLGNVQVAAVFQAFSDGRLPDTAALAPPEAARAALRFAGVVAPSEATVSGVAAYISDVRAASPASEPVAAALAATLSPEFAAGHGS